MDVAAFCKLPLGIIRWCSPKPTLSVVVKATFSLDQDGELRLASTQEPLGIDRPSAGGKDCEELDRPTDFVPRKPCIDVFVVGQAHAHPANSSAIPARVAIGTWEKRFMALSSAEVAAIPLRAPYLRDAEGKPTQVAPLAPWSKARENRPRKGLDAYGFPLPTAPANIFDAYVAAPWDQHPDTLAPLMPLVLEGLLRRARVARMALPSLRPRVLAVRTSETPTEIMLRCDTLGIDTDQAIVTLTFRGEFSLERVNSEPERLMLALEAPHAPIDWRRLWGDLHRASMVKPAMPPPPENDDDDEEDEDARTVTRRVMIQPGNTTPRQPLNSTFENEPVTRTAFVVSSVMPSSALPFRPQSSQSTPPSPEVPRSSSPPSPTKGATLPIPPSATSASGPSSRNSAFFDLPAASISQSALPFRAPGAPAPPPSRPSDTGPASKSNAKTVLPWEAAPISSALPFQQNAAPPSLPVPEFEPMTAVHAPRSAPISSALPFQKNAAPPSLPVPEFEPMTAVHAPRSAPISSALPFQQSAPPASQPAPQPASQPAPEFEPRTSTVVPWAAAMAPVLPFQSSAPPVRPEAPPSNPPDRVRSWEVEDEDTIQKKNLPPARASSALPFGPILNKPDTFSDKPVSPAVTIPAAVAAAAVPAPVIPPAIIPPAAIPAPILPPAAITTKKQTIGELGAWKVEQPAKTQPSVDVEQPAPRLSIDTWAAIKIEIWEQKMPLAEILERHGLDEVDWHDEERRRSALCEEAVRKDQAEPALAAEQALQRAREARANESPPANTTLEDYIALEHEVDRSRHPSAVLTAKGISAIEWKRLRKVFRERAARDPVVAAALRNGRAQRARPGQRPAG